MPEQKKELTTREIMDKVYAMKPEEFNQMMFDNFRRMCSRPLTDASSTGLSDDR